MRRPLFSLTAIKRPSVVESVATTFAMANTDYEDALVANMQLQINAAVALLMDDSDDEPGGATGPDHRVLARSKRRRFAHEDAQAAIHRDYLGAPGDPNPSPLFGAEFPLQFRVTRGRFQRMMEQVQAANLVFFVSKVQRNKAGQLCGPSFESRLLLPLKTLCYGVPPHCFIDYFQMSPQFARECCREFDKAIHELYFDRFLRLPTPQDLKSICSLYKSVHGVDGLIGSLDCSHTHWKNCPKAWQGSYKGKENKPSLVLEAMADYHLFFWHISYGYAGVLNDRTIFSLSPLLERLLNGTFEEAERQAGVVPFTIGNSDPFNRTFILVDGIYPQYSRFVRGIKNPAGEVERRFTAWQEAARKDVERAFGVLKGKFQFMDRPMQLYDLDDTADRVVTCLILHNICVADRVMEHNYDAVYDPGSVAEDVEEEVEAPEDLQQVQGQAGVGGGGGGIGVANAPPAVVDLLTRGDRFEMLRDEGEHTRLHTALMERFNN